MRIGLIASCQKVPKFDFQSQFSTSNIIRIFLNFFHRRIPIKEHIWCWFLCKNLTNFVPMAWKLQNPYCHNSCVNLNSYQSKNVWISRVCIFSWFVFKKRLWWYDYSHKNWNHIIIGWVEKIVFLTSGIWFIFEWSLPQKND